MVLQVYNGFILSTSSARVTRTKNSAEKIGANQQTTRNLVFRSTRSPVLWKRTVINLVEDETNRAEYLDSVFLLTSDFHSSWTRPTNC